MHVHICLQVCVFIYVMTCLQVYIMAFILSVIMAVIWALMPLFVWHGMKKKAEADAKKAEQAGNANVAHLFDSQGSSSSKEANEKL